MRSHSRNGFAIVVVLLVTVVALMAAVGAATIATVSSLQTSTSERRSTSALFAAESGLNTLVVRSRTDTYELLDSDASIQAWLGRVGLDSYDLPDGSTVNLTALNESPTLVTIRSEGISAEGSRRVVLQEYEIEPDVPADLGLFANAALVTQGALNSNSSVSTIIGRDSSLASWVFPDRTLSEALFEEYFVVSGACGDVTYQMTDDADDPAADGTIAVTQIHPSDCSTGLTALAPDTQVTLTPFAVASDTDTMSRGIGTSMSQTFAVTDVTLYSEGNTILIGDGGVATITNVGTGEISVDWSTLPSDRPLAEATPIRREVPSAIAETECPSGPHTADKLPQGCHLQDLSNIWEKTFPTTTKGEMLQIAKDANAWYGPDTTYDWPTGSVTGVTWIDGAQTGNFNGKGNSKSSTDDAKGLCGEGVVILNTGVYDAGSPSTSINLNVSDCEFKGVLYVIGELGIQGNLDSFSGTIIVETDQGTRVQGNGEKAMYDPIAIRKALANLPPQTTAIGLVGSIPTTWRFGE